MTGELTPISNLVEKCHTWNPKKEGQGQFRYIDLSSVDKDKKSIIQVEEVSCQAAPSRARQLVKNGDILVSTVRPNLNGVARVQHEHDGATASTGFCVLRPIPAKLNPEFLFHWVKTPAFVNSIMNVATGANYPAVSDRKVKASLIPCPSLPEQKRIAAILDAADALRAKRRETLAQLDTLLQSTFLEMFGDPATNPKEWSRAHLRELGETQGGLQVSAKRKDLPIERPYLRVANALRGELVLDEIKTIRCTAQEEARTLLEKDDLLIVEGHGNRNEIGRCARWDGSIYPCLHQNHLIRFRCNDSRVLATFIEYFLNSEGGRRSLIGSSRTTSGLNTISVSKVGATLIYLPPIGLQQKFASIVQSAEQQKSRLRAHRDELDTLFASLQARAFAGEL